MVRKVQISGSNFSPYGSDSFSIRALTDTVICHVAGMKHQYSGYPDSLEAPPIPANTSARYLFKLQSNPNEPQCRHYRARRVRVRLPICKPDKTTITDDLKIIIVLGCEENATTVK
ncbi:hypothetical protein CVT25_008755 [Psilocybe cyanescens]|uniref:Uncharacterized protein n=1 Tax=Psilocybe cyanescens TaxID=93625 RepID=A0A409XNL2_PSICY|nr:hypothetical protein CVT25_008755 [Psilocybe cyanescens]